MTTMLPMLIDSKGVALPRKEVKRRAHDNIRNSMGLDELISYYMDGMTDEELLEWATTFDGTFIEVTK